MPAVAVADVMITGSTPFSGSQNSFLVLQKGPNYQEANAVGAINLMHGYTSDITTLTGKASTQIPGFELEGMSYYDTYMLNVLDFNVTLSGTIYHFGHNWYVKYDTAGTVFVNFTAYKMPFGSQNTALVMMTNQGKIGELSAKQMSDYFGMYPSQPSSKYVAVTELEQGGFAITLPKGNLSATQQSSITTLSSSFISHFTKTITYDISFYLPAGYYGAGHGNVEITYLSPSFFTWPSGGCGCHDFTPDPTITA